MQSPQRRNRRVWVVVAVVIAAAFLAGILIDSQFLAGTVLNPRVSDSYPIGDCLNGCGQNFVFSPDLVTVTVTHDGSVIYQSTTPNLITNAGEDTIIDGAMACGAISAPACVTTGPVYIALTSLSSPTPSVTDTYCFSGSSSANEVTGSGMGRAQGTYVAGSQTSPYTHIIKNTFTYTGSTPLTITGVCMFNAASGGTLFAEDALSSTATVSASGDQLTITWTFTH